MNAPSNNYVKLPGVGHQLGSYTRLYRGGDHLLQVSSVTFSEQYKRFYFRDIQAFMVIRTNTWIVIIALLLILALLLTGTAVGSGDSVASIVLGGFAALLLVLALIVGLRGPSCRCYVRTAVQTEKLPSLNRLRRTEKVLAELKPLLDAAQGPMPPVEPAIPVSPVSKPLPTAGPLPPESSAS
jgi:hypothetical protein